MKLWKKLLLYFISLIGTSSICIMLVVACGGEVDPYDYYTSFFHPDIQGKKDYGAFYFTDYQFTYSDEEPLSESAVNSAEWAQYVGQPVRASDVEKVMYHLDSAAKIGVSDFLEQNTPLGDSLSSNKFLLSLKDPSHSAAKKYYQFAHQVEYLGLSSYNAWEPEPLDTVALNAAASQAMEYAGVESDGFLRLRYLYQAQKLNHYAENYKEAKDIYDQYIAKMRSKSHVKGWALALKAGEERRLGDTIQAAYLFSKVFANYPERRIQAYRNYHYIGAPFDQVLALSQDQDEKANLYAIKGFADPEIEMDNLEKVYANAPASPLVGVLLVREINKLEEYYLTPSLNNNTDEFHSRRLQAQVDGLPAAAANKWPLWAGLIVSLAGVILIILTFRKQTKPFVRSAGGILVIAGIAGILWFTIGRPSVGAKAQRTPQGTFFVAVPDSVKVKYESHLEQLRNFCTKMSSDSKYPEPQIGAITNAYLYFMQNKPEEGITALNKAKGLNISSKLSDQKMILTLLLSAQRMKQVNTVEETTLLPLLKWLKGKVIAGDKPRTDTNQLQDAEENKYAITQRNFYTYILAPTYLRQGDTAKAALVMLNGENGSANHYNYAFSGPMPDFWYTFLHARELKQIIEWKTHHSKDAYITFLTESMKQIKQSSLYELLGTIQLRDHHYVDAVASFKAAPSKADVAGKDQERVTSGDPFEVKINDYPLDSSPGINKLQFAEAMSKLEAKLKKNPKNAEVLFSLANGIYNTSTYGNSWILISYAWSSYDFGRKSLYDYDTDYIKTSVAKQYYLKARDLSTDQDFKAKCTFLAAKCEQKQYEAPSYLNYETYEAAQKEYMKSIRHNSYFNQMQAYKSTAFYQAAVQECSYLRDFIKSN